MQLRHIRPGSLEWQDALAEEMAQNLERLTPEEIRRLRELSEEQKLATQPAQQTSATVH
jgi:hypothetical protein